MMITDEALYQAGVRLGDALSHKGWQISTAESCTGGWVVKVLTDRAGSSGYVHSGLTTYSNHAKQTLLGVSETTLIEQGAVSEAVVREMVTGALRVTGAQVAVAVSGIAGPDGGSADKPVGTVWFAWGTGAAALEAEVKTFGGDREAVRRQAALFALQGVTTFLRQQ
ncbi:nicotinamide-nucleotide amidohydrolase family protein [Marinobacter sp. X15-166B]|uniref:nicotinamide-nucleotide amidohydrolase family protein n=1 Tax=Marinobacter sp. X15-166B TaxID=1897620 RepID=UPI00085BDD27|nr:nicotinamide-nucleotide amidohydrolase family protein [Marinobacter sp. X15-166B]OEY66959.1 damage-inducible protein CinA [Marinobacter sp. X15-166B]